MNGGIGVGRQVADGVLGNEVDGGLKDRLEKLQAELDGEVEVASETRIGAVLAGSGRRGSRGDQSRHGSVAAGLDSDDQVARGCRDRQ